MDICIYPWILKKLKITNIIFVQRSRHKYYIIHINGYPFYISNPKYIIQCPLLIEHTDT